MAVCTLSALLKITIITVEDASKIIVRILGYEPYAEYMGGQYTKTAEQLELAIGGAKREALTREEAAALIYKALHKPMAFMRKPDKEPKDGAYELYIADGTNGEELKTLYTAYYDKENN